MDTVEINSSECDAKLIDLDVTVLKDTFDETNNEMHCFEPDANAEMNDLDLEFGREVKCEDHQTNFENNNNSELTEFTLDAEPQQTKVDEETILDKENDTDTISKATTKCDIPDLLDLTLNTDMQENQINEEPILDKEKDSDIKSKAAKKFDIPTAAGSVCDVCTKSVYPMERLMLDNKCYHKTCLKCCKCGKTLNPTVVSKFNNNIFCKPHYIELFRKRGRYDDINVDGDTKQDKGSSNSPSVSPTARAEVGTRPKDNVPEVVKNADGVSTGSEHKPPSVHNATKAWTEKAASNEGSDWKKTNSNNSSSNTEEEQSVSAHAKVKNLASMFETNPKQ